MPSTFYDKIQHFMTKYNNLRQNTTKYDKIQQYNKIRQNSTKYNNIRRSSTSTSVYIPFPVDTFILYGKKQHFTTFYDRFQQNTTNYNILRHFTAFYKKRQQHDILQHKTTKYAILQQNMTHYAAKPCRKKSM